VTFTNVPPGSYGYYCTPHVFVGMVGSVTILPANQPPEVSFLAPAQGDIVPAGTPLEIHADALDADGRVVRVDFFADDNFLGSDSVGPFMGIFPNPTLGEHTLRIQAVDDRGATSAPVSIVIIALLPPVILQQPQNTNVLEMRSASFSVTASGSPPLTYQWSFNASPIESGTNSTLAFSAVRLSDAGLYSVSVSNAAGFVTSVSAELGVSPNQLPRVQLLQPTNGTLLPDLGSVELIATASDVDGSVARVEFFNGTNLLAIVPNAPYSLSLSNLRAGAEYRFTALVVDDLNGRSRSAEAMVSVLPVPVIGIVSPTNGQALPTEVPFAIIVTNPASMYPLTREYFGDGQLLATDEFASSVRGYHELSAVVTDIVGQRATSAPVAVRLFLSETAPPEIRLTHAPANFARVQQTTVSLAGDASDDIEVLRVEVQNETSGEHITATGTTSWTANVRLVAGMNTIRVRAVDQAFNVSPWITRYCTFVVLSPLTVQTQGQGGVTPDWNQRLLEIGKSYRLRARPATGYVFARWHGALYQGATLDFTMISNLLLRAEFIPLPFVEEAGAFTGLLWDTNSFIHAANGLITLQLASSGNFSGNIRAAGQTHSFRGTLDETGFASAVALRPGRKPVTLALQLHEHAGGPEFAGSATDGDWVSNLRMTRNPFQADRQCYYFGDRTFIWCDADGTVATNSLKISVAGRASASVRFVGGGKASLTSAVSGDGAVALSFYSPSRGTLLGWVDVQSASDPSVTGTGLWIPLATNLPPAEVRAKN
jgi:hypothetical protein